MEKHVKHVVQWLACLLHYNELPLRHLFEHLDVLSTGPRSFSGAMEPFLHKCEKIPVAKFESIPSEFPAVDAGNLSVDQQYLFDICLAGITGKFSDQLSHRQPGKLVVSRWLTLRIRVLRLYIATKNPSYNLRMIAEFVVKIYGPIWFAIKTKKSCTGDSRHLWLMIHKSRIYRRIC